MAFDPNSKDTNADRRYFASGQVSAINHGFEPCRRGRIGQPLPTAPVGGILDKNETNADKKYYANPPSGKPQSRPRPPTPAEMFRGADGGGQRLKPLLLKQATEVGVVRDAVVSLFRQGLPYAIVQAAGDDLLSRIRVALDLAETRGLITPQQRSAVRLETLPRDGIEVAARAFGTIKPEDVPLAVEEEAELTEEQMRAIVAGPAEPEMQNGSAPVPVTTGEAPMLAQIPAAAPVSFVPPANPDVEDNEALAPPAVQNPALAEDTTAPALVLADADDPVLEDPMVQMPAAPLEDTDA